MAQYIQSAKLVGTGAVNSPYPAGQGTSVALSVDGTVAVVGGPYDNTYTGAVWVFTQSGGVWTQPGSKLVATGAIGPAAQGSAVALSADGSTLVIGGPNDNSNAGAVWVFTQSGGVWTQQAKLVGTGALGPAYQGTSVALSGDGSTVAIGGPSDNSGAGAVWIFTQSGGVWTQQAKLLGSGATGVASEQGSSVALSTDGSTLILGGPNDNNGTGAVWVFTRSGGTWSQQGRSSSGLLA